MNVACPSCDSVYRIDPARVPAGGIRTRCRECRTLFRVEALTDQAPGDVATGTLVEPEPAAAPAPAAAPGAAPAGSAPAARPAGAPAFGPQDPEVRAKRLARALVSDIVVYNPERLERSRATGSLRQDFRNEILKSWEEYVEQVGEEKAKKTTYFRDALNDILAQGKRVF